MISDITLGQFFPGFSPLHKMDPRMKIIAAVIYIAAIFTANTPAAFAFMIIATFLMIIIGRISLKVVLKAVKPIIFILIFTAIINVFLTNGEGEPLIAFWVIKIYKEGIIRAVFMALRVVILIIGTSVLLTYTTSPIALTDGIESLLSPLKLIKVPVHTFAMMMSIALRFIPTLIEETEKIMNAQKSRGADFSSGGLKKRAKALVPILVPLFVSSFKRAEELATAMECRCYRGDKNRTKMKALSFKARDFFAFVIFSAILTLVILSRNTDSLIKIKHVVLDIIFYKL